jgi:hypothetical protein
MRANFWERQKVLSDDRSREVKLGKVRIASGGDDGMMATLCKGGGRQAKTR